jgi:putative membrane protein
MRIWRGVLAGLIGGVVAAGAMSVVHKSLARISTGAGQQTPPTNQHQDDDATVKVADGFARWFLHRPLREDTKPLAGNVVHYAFGASVGALYGGGADVVPRVTTAVGLPFGVAVWLGAHVITVPALGLAEPPTRRPLSKEGLEFGLHLVYGAVTELMRRLVHLVL